MITNKRRKTKVRIDTDSEDVFHRYRINNSLNLDADNIFVSKYELKLGQFETVLLATSQL